MSEAGVLDRVRIKVGGRTARSLFQHMDRLQQDEWELVENENASTYVAITEMEEDQDGEEEEEEGEDADVEEGLSGAEGGGWGTEDEDMVDARTSTKRSGQEREVWEEGREGDTGAQGDVTNPLSPHRIYIVGPPASMP